MTDARSATVAVIGAGLAGLTAARVMATAGLAVRVYDKSRGPGGRMATRRGEDGAVFDHGAAYITAHPGGFADQIATWTAAGHVAAWFEGAFVGTPDMTAPTRALAANLDLITDRTISTLETQRGGWRLSADDGPILHPPDGFDAVVLAIPAPQAQAIVYRSGVSLPGLATARFDPCWTLMAAFAEPISGWGERVTLDHGIFAWSALNGSKPGRPASPACYVAHATASWSRAHLELTKDAACAELLAAFRQLTRANAPPLCAMAHRWRYGLVAEAAGVAHLWDTQAMIGACGDWCLGARLEHAYASGDSLGRTIAEQLASARPRSAAR
jgi:renalase